MHGDFSRLTFDRAKRYSSVLQQQGRVQTDADWNEAALIERYHDETSRHDIIGPTGTPRERLGFAVTPSGTDLRISDGRYYVDGMLVENDAPAMFSAQLGVGAPTAAGVYAAFIDAWPRDVSVVEDPSIRETALGGPDTATRLQNAWRVRLMPVNVANDADCDAVGAAWAAALPSSTGSLLVRTQAVAAPTTPCELPASALYRGLENHLYRVEVHQGGTLATARFKWSRENGSIASAIDASSTASITLRDLRNDDTLGFDSGQWVEVLDDVREAENGAGVLCLIQQVQRETRTLVIDPTTPVPAGLGAHARVRRWDQSGAGVTSAGVSLVPGGGLTAVRLESGLEVVFQAGNYQPGDYWVVAARTAVGAETGNIEWPANTSLPPFGVRHRYALLGAVSFVPATGYTSLPNATDCREIFPSLTDLRAEDVSYNNGVCALPGVTNVQEALDALCSRREDCCGTVIEPVAGWEAVFDTIPSKGAHFCFRPTDYALAAAKRIEGTGTLILTGHGMASRIVAPDTEAALILVGWEQVIIRDLKVVSGTAGKATPDADMLNGAVTLENVGNVVVEGLHAACGASNRKKSACLAIRSTEANGVVARPSDVRVVGCTFEVGYMQMGLLLVNMRSAVVRDNIIRARPEIPSNAAIGRRVTNKLLRTQIARMLVSHSASTTLQQAVTQPTVTTQPGGLVTLSAGVQQLTFRTDARVAGSWAGLVARVPVTDTSNANAVNNYVFAMADRIIIDPAFRDQFTAISAWFGAVRAEALPAGAQGVAIGGRLAGHIEIAGNTMEGMIEGIHVGVSHRTGLQNRFPSDKAAHVVIANNDIGTVLPAAQSLQRYGIYVGNCESALIENNVMRVTRTSLTNQMHVDGIHLYGEFGRRIIVRQNQTRGYSVGVSLTGIRVPTGAKLWLVGETMAEGARIAVQVAPPGAAILSNNF